MTTSEAAAYLRVKPETLRGWARDGTVPAHHLPGGRTYRYRADELDEALEQVARSWGFTDEGAA